MSESIQGWIDNPAAWNEVYLADIKLPGIASVGDIECGPRFDKQTRRKREGTKLRDNGIEPAKFTIELLMTGAQWGDWRTVIPKIWSVAPTNARQPFTIKHPLPNSMGVDTVYILKIAPGAPTAKGGFKVKIKVEQWFPELPEAKPKTKVKSPVSKYITEENAQDAPLVGLDAIEKYGLDLDPFQGRREVDPLDRPD